MPLTPEQIHADHLREKSAYPARHSRRGRSATMSTPTTKAGRDLLDILDRHGVSDDLNVGLGDILAIEDEAAATERRLTVERIRREVHEYMEHASLMAGELKIDRDDFDSILDDLATADVDEQMAEANREMEADLWNSDR